MGVTKSESPLFTRMHPAEVPFSRALISKNMILTSDLLGGVDEVEVVLKSYEVLPGLSHRWILTACNWPTMGQT